VAVARALANDPGTLLMDEPFGALDAVTRDSMQRQMLELKQRLHKTIVFVTHDILEAVTLGNRIAVMHEGRLQQIGDGAELVNRPANDFVRDLFRKAMEKLDMLRDLVE
jgi:ABC-type proline/glycine betaine transport system ATPase subunit